MTTDDQVLNAQQAAEFLGAHVETVRRLARKGEIPSFKLGTDWRFSKDALRKWFDEQQPAHRPPSVMIVDDDEEVLGSMSRAVSRLGCRVQTADNGGAALDLVSREAPDLIFLDLQMPLMDGAAFLEQLRPEHPDLPVAIVTGYPDSDLMDRAAQHPPLLLLKKPATSAQVESTVRALLGQHLRAG